MPGIHKFQGILLRMALQQQMTSVRRFIYWFFGDEDGHIVIFQYPNLPLFLALGAYLVRMFSSTWIFWVAEVIFLIAITWWAVLEIRSGASRFRRTFGAVVLVGVLISQTAMLING